MNSKLNNKNWQIILQCMECIFQGPYISDVAFSTRVGISRSQLKSLIDAWPNIDDSNWESYAHIGVNNVLNEICHGVSISTSDWDNWFDVSRREVKEVYKRWALCVGKRRRGLV